MMRAEPRASADLQSPRHDGWLHAAGQVLLAVVASLSVGGLAVRCWWYRYRLGVSSGNHLLNIGVSVPPGRVGCGRPVLGVVP